MSRRNEQKRTRYNTLASPPLPSVPQQAVVRARESPRERLTSQVSSRPRTTSSPSLPRRKRAVTLSGNASTLPQLGADSSNPVVIEMRRGSLLDVGNVVKQFLDLNANVRAFCDEISDHTGQSKRLPRLRAQSSALPENSTPVGKPAHEFSSPEEYVFFVLLSIINTHIYDDIFRPFHPAASAQESNRYEEEYLKMIDTSLQMQAATWRSQKFSSIERRVNAGGVALLIRGFTGTIVDELTKALEQLPGQTSFPDALVPGLGSILRDAYDWNRTVKKDILKYDFEPYVVEPFAAWDPTQMESFERLRRAILPNTKVISSVSLGLIGSVSLGGSRVSHVQRKARVLVEEWFLSAPRGRTMSAHPRSPSVPPVPSIPPPVPGQRQPRVTDQPRRAQEMTMPPPPAPPPQTPAPQGEGGSFCC